jgi:hypothetical protein
MNGSSLAQHAAETQALAYYNPTFQFGNWTSSWSSRPAGGGLPARCSAIFLLGRSAEQIHFHGGSVVSQLS